MQGRKKVNMTYVYNDLASEIKRKPTEEETKLVNQSGRRQKELYDKYMRLHNTLSQSLSIRLWEEYQKELKRYNDLYNQYMGYCYY
jgi:hypothetical protein